MDIKGNAISDSSTKDVHSLQVVSPQGKAGIRKVRKDSFKPSRQPSVKSVGKETAYSRTKSEIKYTRRLESKEEALARINNNEDLMPLQKEGLRRDVAKIYRHKSIFRPVNKMNAYLSKVDSARQISIGQVKDIEYWLAEKEKLEKKLTDTGLIEKWVEIQPDRQGLPLAYENTEMLKRVLAEIPVQTAAKVRTLLLELVQAQDEIHELVSRKDEYSKYVSLEMGPQQAE